MSAQASLDIKDEYTFDFPELAEEHSERQLELALLKNVRRFLSEMDDLKKSLLHQAFSGNL